MLRIEEDFSGVLRIHDVVLWHPRKDGDRQNMYLRIGDRVLTAKMVDNSSTQALFELLAKEPLTLHMSDYAGMEKGAQLPNTLPQNNEPMNTVPGDIILYQGRTFVIYYDTNSWSLTP